MKNESNLVSHGQGTKVDNEILMMANSQMLTNLHH